MKREINQYSPPADQQPGSSEREQALVARVLAGERECFAELVAGHPAMAIIKSRPDLNCGYKEEAVRQGAAIIQDTLKKLKQPPPQGGLAGSHSPHHYRQPPVQPDNQFQLLQTAAVLGGETEESRIRRGGKGFSFKI